MGLFDVESGEGEFFQPHDGKDVNSVSYSESGELLLTEGDWDVTLHDLGPEPAEPRLLVGHEQTVLRAIYSPDGSQLATVSGDMTVRLWDLETYKELFALRLPAVSQPGTPPMWDFDFRCTDRGECWIAVPLTMGRLALYRLPYQQPPPSLAERGVARRER